MTLIQVIQILDRWLQDLPAVHEVSISNLMSCYAISVLVTQAILCFTLHSQGIHSSVEFCDTLLPSKTQTYEVWWVSCLSKQTEEYLKLEPDRWTGFCFVFFFWVATHASASSFNSSIPQVIQAVKCHTPQCPEHPLPAFLLLSFPIATSRDKMHNLWLSQTCVHKL